MYTELLLQGNISKVGKFLQEVQNNKKLNLTDEQKISFKEVLVETLYGGSEVKSVNNIQKQLLLSGLTELNHGNDYRNLLLTNLDENSNLSIFQKQLLNSISNTKKDAVLNSNILTNALSDLTLHKNTENSSSLVDNNMIKSKAKSSYQQQMAMKLSSGYQAMASRIEQINSHFA
ncbi:hypothetical protein KDN24_10765 [Bacillus sp. Bva_UNVM-123]|uniref:hypothetical protein n=1 Tax=Bacillus sp. Bva_UNVM-123 TaxID=2829798 RepID=UPI00391F2593